MKKSTVISIILSLVIVISVCSFGYAKISDKIVTENEISGKNRDDGEAQVDVVNTDTVESLGAKLKEAGLIKDDKIFVKYVKSLNLFTNLGDNTYRMQKNLSYKQIMTKLKEKTTLRITIPEGYEMRQIVDLLVSKNLGTKEEYEEVIRNYDYEYDFITSLEKSDSRLEGYLYPDTYEVFADEKPEAVIGRFLKNFDEKTKEVRAECKKQGIVFRNMVTLASIIEREAKDEEEFGKVSSVFNNRIKRGMKLESCATVEYLLKERKAVLSIADTQIQSPYNTYMYAGLPPAPIANPRASAIEKALTPDKTDYLFFRLNSAGDHVFSRTLAEHDAVQ